MQIFFFFSKISHMYLLQKKARLLLVSFDLFCAGHRRDCTFIQKFMCKTCKQRTSESQFSTAPERWMLSDRRSDFTPHLPEAITIKKGKTDPRPGFKERRKLRKKEKMQNNPSASNQESHNKYQTDK